MAHVAFAIAAGVQALGTLQQGRYQSAALKIQAKQAELKGRANALQYFRESLKALEQHRKFQGTIMAVSGANGVDPFSGSAMTVDQRNAFKMGEEYNFGIEQGDMAIMSGLAESQALNAAAKQVKLQSYIGAASSIAMGVYGYNQLAPGGGAPTPQIADFSTMTTMPTSFSFNTVPVPGLK